MRVITNLIRKLKGFEKSIPDILREGIEENQEIILDYNTEAQLYEEGITRDNVSIASYAPYSPMTIAIKKEKGQPTNRVTLRDTGDFEASFFIDFTADGFEIKAGDWKAEKLMLGYGDEIIGLTDENLNDIIYHYLYPKVLNELKDKLNGKKN